MVLLKRGCFCCMDLKSSMICFAILCLIGSCVSLAGIVHIVFCNNRYYEELFSRHFVYHHWKEFMIFLYTAFGISCFGVISTISSIVPTCYKIQRKDSRGFVIPFILSESLVIGYSIAVLAWSHFILKRASPRLENGILYLQIIFSVWALMVGISYYQWLGEQGKCSQWKAARIQQGPYRQLAEDIEETPEKNKQRVPENLYFVI